MTIQTAAGTPLSSRYNGFCRNCRTAYSAGTMIARRDGAYVHAECPQVERINPEETRRYSAPDAPRGVCRSCGTYCYGDCEAS